MSLSNVSAIVNDLSSPPDQPESSDDPPPPAPTNSQLALDLTPSNHFQVIHGKHKHSVAYLSLAKDKQITGHEVMTHQDAHYYAPFAGDSQSNTYISQAGFTGNRRTVSSVAVLPSLFIDLDHYKLPELQHLTPAELVNHIIAKEPWLPVPTYVADSGRGAYLLWLFPKPLDKSSLPRWQTTINCLVDLLKEYGADPQAKDAARVLRLAWSIHTGTGNQVQYNQLGTEVKFNELEQLIRSTHEISFPRATVTPKQERKQLTGQVSRSNVRSLFNTHTLHWGRMQDLTKLAELRAPLNDYRHRMLYHFAVSAAWFCPSVDSLRSEVTSLAEAYFVNPQRYTNHSRFKSITERMILGKGGGKVSWGHRKVDYRYRVRTPTIMDALDITTTEQRHMGILIDAKEKYRRKVEKRRTAGVLERHKYIAKVHQETAGKKQLALDLREAGKTNRQISEELSITSRTVRRLVNG